ncbi:MAG TPA: oligosaccharide flippase family protein [Chitinivibrionales bacterium]|nr:oligosaccharide flippase family protein [Chitinivibrionales bacterium]
MDEHKKLNLMYLFKGSALYGAADVFTAAVRFVLIAVYTRILAPADFGVYSLITATLSLLCVMVPLGLPSAIMMSFKPNDPLGNTSLKNTAFWLLFRMCAGGGIVFYLCGLFFFKQNIAGQISLWLIVQAASEMVSMVPKSSLRFNQKIVQSGLGRVLRVIIMVAVLLTLLWNHRTGLKAIFISEAIAAAAEFLLCCAFDKFVPSFAPKTAIAPLLGIGLPVTAMSIGIILNDLSNRYVVFFMLGEQATGYFAAAAKVAIIGSFFAEALNAMWFPYYFMLSRQKELPEDEIRDFSRKIVLLSSLLISLLAICLPQLVAFHAFGKYFIAPQYHAVAVLVAPLVLAYFFKMTLFTATPVMSFQNRIWRLALIITVAAIVNIAGTIVCARLLGTTDLFLTLFAIALMTSASYCLCMAWASREAGLFPLPSWVFSGWAVFSIAALATAFLPVGVIYKLGGWVVVAGVVYWRYFLRSNVWVRLFSVGVK